jgi:two-component system, OmpR family, response regulator ResD
MAKILVVDDDEDVSALFKEQLEQAGHKVNVAGSGKACLTELRKNKYDLVLMDMFMPGMSGRETLEHISNGGRIKDNKVAFLTVASVGGKGLNELKYLGAVDYIKKPISATALVARVKKILATS